MLGPRAKRGLAGRRPAAKRLARYGEGGATAAAAAGATSERPPRSSRERAVLPSKEMRSLPCAAHLGSPRCYFYLTFQGPFPFSGCFCCDSTVASTSLFPSLPFASSFTLSFLSMHSFLPLHRVPSPPSPQPVLTASSRRARSKLTASVPMPVNPQKRQHKPPTATQIPNWQHWAQPPLSPASKGSQGEMPGGVHRQHTVISRLGSSRPPLLLLCFIWEGADGLVEGGGLCSSLDAEKGSESPRPKPPSRSRRCRSHRVPSMVYKASIGLFWDAGRMQRGVCGMSGGNKKENLNLNWCESPHGGNRKGRRKRRQCLFPRRRMELGGRSRPGRNVAPVAARCSSGRPAASRCAEPRLPGWVSLPVPACSMP